jgi:leader peptidase (prepilin peptidase)/N-methyltransferase
MFLLLVIAFIFGLTFGSFLNVVIYRYNTGRSIAIDRSACNTCGISLRWYELVPLVSFAIQGGKCRVCKSKISWQYPIIEFITGLTVAGLVWFFYPIQSQYQAGEFLYYLVIFCILIVILVYDFRHQIIPDGLVYTFIALTFAHYLITHTTAASWSYPYFLDFLAGPILFVFFFLMWALSKGRWMGFGDAKLVLGIGLMLGFVSGLNAVVLGFWIGAVVSVALLLVKRLVDRRQLFKGIRNLSIKSEIPFAPFLIIGLVIEFFFYFDVIGLSKIFF